MHVCVCVSQAPDSCHFVVAEPDPVKNVEITQRNASHVTLRWDAPTHSNGPLKEYVIRAAFGGDTQEWTQRANRTSGTFDLNCPRTDEVNYTVTAVNDEYRGAPSEPVKASCVASANTSEYF